MSTQHDSEGFMSKPAHLECEPTTGTNIQRTTPNKQQSSKTTRISSRNPQGPPRPGSADTQDVQQDEC